jgi:uncharacterized membrane protein YhaH (DUF805 family)
MQPPQFSRTAPDFHPVTAPIQGDWMDRFVAFFFDPHGRVSRLGYRVSRTVFVLAYLGLTKVGHQIRLDLHAAAISHTHDAGTLLYVLAELVVITLAGLIVFGSDILVTLKRWHDLDKPGAWALLGFIPILGWVPQLIACMFIRGTQGPNRFGAHPRAGRY